MSGFLSGLCRTSAVALFCLPAFAIARQAAIPTGAAPQSQAAPPPAPQAPSVTRHLPAAPLSPSPRNGRIDLDVVVTDAQGNPVRGLTQQDFTLLDNGKPRPILSFHAYDAALHRPDSPVSVVLVLDGVNIQFRHVAYIRQEVAKFLRQNGGHLAQPVSMLFLTDTEVRVLAQPSFDGDALATKLDKADSRLRDITMRAGDYGADDRYQISLQLFLAVVNDLARVPGRKLVIWLGWGWPMLSGPEFGQPSARDQKELFNLIVSLSTELRQDRIAVCSAAYGEPDRFTYLYQNFLKGIQSPYQTTADNLALKVLATQSGGRVLFPSNDLAGEIDSCVKDVSAFYTLSFQPPHAGRPNEYHELKVQVDKPKVTARTNTGYYDDPKKLPVP